MGIYRVSNQPNVLCGWVWGQGARTVEKLSNEEILSTIRIIFTIFLQPFFQYTDPIEIQTSKWSSNPFARGSYSGRSMAADKRGGTAAKLAQPLKNIFGIPVVLFCGEATHPKFYSTVHGAVASGIREADRLMKL